MRLWGGGFVFGYARPVVGFCRVNASFLVPCVHLSPDWWTNISWNIVPAIHVGSYGHFRHGRPLGFLNQFALCVEVVGSHDHTTNHQSPITKSPPNQTKSNQTKPNQNTLKFPSRMFVSRMFGNPQQVSKPKYEDNALQAHPIIGYPNSWNGQCELHHSTSYLWSSQRNTQTEFKQSRQPTNQSIPRLEPRLSSQNKPWRGEEKGKTEVKENENPQIKSSNLNNIPPRQIIKSVNINANHPPPGAQTNLEKKNWRKEPELL